MGIVGKGGKLKDVTRMEWSTPLEYTYFKTHSLLF
jgi:hypothetical protein